MKTILAVGLAAIISGCSTTNRVSDYFYEHVVNEYCDNPFEQRRTLRSLQNEGRDHKVYIVCKDDALKAFNP